MRDGQSLSDELVAFIRQKFNFAGIVVAIGRLDAQSSQINMISAPRAPEADGDTLFEIGSLTKPITALTLASMVQTHDVTLDMPIGELFPEGVRAPEKDGRQITLLDLATHRSGLPRLPPNIGWSVPRRLPIASCSRRELHLFEFRLRFARHATSRSRRYSVRRACTGTRFHPSRDAFKPGRLQGRFSFDPGPYCRRPAHALLAH